MRSLMVLTLAALLAAAPGTRAADTGPEAAWAHLLEQHPGAGTAAVWLQSGQQKVLALYADDRTGKHDGAVIILHDMGQHPDWPEVVSPLRNALPDHGWATLSVQMPVLGPERSLQDYAPLFAQVAPRLAAAVAWLKAKQFSHIVVAGWGLGAGMAASYLAGAQAPDVGGLVAVGILGIAGQKPPLDPAQWLEKIKIPVFDIYGSRDLAPVLRGAPGRTQSARRAGAVIRMEGGFDRFSGNSTGESTLTKESGYVTYRQVSISGADHEFTAMSDTLTDRVLGWLNRNFGSGAQPGG